MPTLHLVCGLPGSGKTTLARRLEAQGALRLAPDEWMARLVGDGYDEARRAEVEAIQAEIAMRVLALGADVVLESGFWSRAEREAFRARAAAVGSETRLHFLDVPREELLRRLEARNADLPPHTFHVDAALLDACIPHFEPPHPDELDPAP